MYGIMKKDDGHERDLLGLRIRSLRTKKGWTQQELGNQADVNYKFIGEIERGQQNPSFNVLVKIADAMGVDLPELFRFESVGMNRKEMESRLQSIIKALSDDELSRMLTILKALYPVQ
jgi:transcriptional regulator with XRE-family HTH domain